MKYKYKNSKNIVYEDYNYSEVYNCNIRQFINTLQTTCLIRNL